MYSGCMSLLSTGQRQKCNTVDMDPPLLKTVEPIYSLCEASSEVQLLPL